MTGKSGNLLGQETSPYLLQHKDNPVHWHAWGPDALRAAQDAGKPVLLSVGYAACHWCHVMAHESFEDPAVAEIMNRHFINIKVDREERPDIDAIYMNALHGLGEQGGWPLTMFLTPAGEPFWGGTYFPKTPVYGRPGFIQLLEEIARLYRDEPEKIEQNRTALARHLSHLGENTAPLSSLPPSLPDDAAMRLLTIMDPANGGVRGAPKFPQPMILELMWRVFRRTGNKELSNAVVLALDALCAGGIYDHLGGGFSRYSTDERWLAPHFEKMLYDNALLVSLLTMVWRTTRKERYRQCVEDTINWMTREMTLPEGVLAASLDADSDGGEGRFYTWRTDEVATVLGPDADAFCKAYDITPGGNWEGVNILNRLPPKREPETPAEEKRLADARARLFATRMIRPAPARDDKALADWNGLAIQALAQAAHVFDRPDWMAAAIAAFDFVASAMVRNGRLHHSWCAGKPGPLAVSDDYANMIRAALLLFEATGNDRFLNTATDWLGVLDRHYEDKERGGYFYTASDAEALIVRTRPAHDNATPAANNVMVDAFTRLAALTGDPRWQVRADAQIQAFSGDAANNAFAMAGFLNGMDQHLNSIEITLCGGASAQSLHKAALEAAPPAHVIRHDPAAPAGVIICRGQTCSPRLDTGPAIIRTLDESFSLPPHSHVTPVITPQEGHPKP